jgi:ribosomal protein S27AE
MKSIKPGRGPSALGAAGSVATVIFGVFWTILTINLTKNIPFPIVGVIFPLFGLIFIGIGIAQAIFHYKNATGKNRMSLLDITDDSEEPDPLNEYFNKSKDIKSDTVKSGKPRKFEGEFCPYCGNKVKDDFDFCPNCGKDI